MSVRVLSGDARTVLATLPNASVQCCVTSPPYFGLRAYLTEDHADKAQEMGSEATPDTYVAALVAVFRELRRVLRDDGTCWLNLGDSYVSSASGAVGASSVITGLGTIAAATARPSKASAGKPKDLLMIPARVALALQADGWWLRSDIIWHKPNPMPESVTDRPTSSHEHVFLLSKRATYFFDAAAIAEDAIRAGDIPGGTDRYISHITGGHNKDGLNANGLKPVAPTRNSRNVWTIATNPFPGSHFAVMPTELVERCIKAGSRPGDTILDPFGGAGTTALVADRLGRDAVLIELNPAYCALAERRIVGDAPLFAQVAAQ